MMGRSVLWTRIRLVQLFASAMTVIVIVFTFGAVARATATTASSVIKAAKKAVAGQAGVHVVLVAKNGSSSDIEKIVGDVGRTGGTEEISEDKATLTVEVTSSYAYASGNSSGLTTIFGLSSADAKKVGKRWVSWKAGSSQYSQIKSDTTVPSVAALLPDAKGTKLSTEITNGSTFYVLKWTTAATSSTPAVSNSFTISGGAAMLPVKEVATDSTGTKVTTSFSSWGEQVAVTVPPLTSTVASSKITG
jgi:hypothetical protein